MASSPQERPSGEYRTLSKITFADYAAGWIDTYQGRTSRGIDESTRADYRKRLEQERSRSSPGRRSRRSSPAT